MLPVVNAIAWAIVSGVGVELYVNGELDTTGEITLAICVGLFGWNLLSAILQ